MKLIVAIHGILTSDTTASWPDKFHGWIAKREPSVQVLKKEYRAGPFPKWNCFFKDPKLAKSLCNEVLQFDEETPLWIVAHSNGAVIALQLAKRLISQGRRLDGLILTGAACSSDVEETGILKWVADGQLGQAWAFSSAQDGVVNTRGIWRLIKWPYGSLGRDGWTRAGRTNVDAPYESRQIRTCWYAGGHSGYFKPEQIQKTFEDFWQVIQGANKWQNSVAQP